MKLMIASDIHGDAYWMEQVLQAYKKEDADYLILLGDLLNHGPRNGIPPHYDPQKVAELLNAEKEHVFCIRGNCDSEVDQMLIEVPILAENSQILTEERILFLSHGHHYNTENLPPLKKGSIFLQGHTHVPMIEERQGILCGNPGSPTFPKEGSAPGYLSLIHI